MRLYKLPETVLSVKGKVEAFLNGISSNVLDAPLNAFLNQHGRIIATFRQKKISDEEFLISVPNAAAGQLLQHLQRYAKLAHVTITPDPQGCWIDLDTAQIIWSSENFPDSVREEEFTRFRLEHRMPLMGIDYQADEFILNVHEHDYTSYTKGCFLGQEPVAKVHNRSQPSRKLIVAFEDQLSDTDADKMSSRLADPATGRVQGFVFIKPIPSQPPGL